MYSNVCGRPLPLASARPNKPVLLDCSQSGVLLCCPPGRCHVLHRLASQILPGRMPGQREASPRQAKRRQGNRAPVRQCGPSPDTHSRPRRQQVTTKTPVKMTTSVNVFCRFPSRWDGASRCRQRLLRHQTTMGFCGGPLSNGGGKGEQTPAHQTVLVKIIRWICGSCAPPYVYADVLIRMRTLMFLPSQEMVLCCSGCCVFLVWMFFASIRSQRSTQSSTFVVEQRGVSHEEGGGRMHHVALDVKTNNPVGAFECEFGA